MNRLYLKFFFVFVLALGVLGGAFYLKNYTNKFDAKQILENSILKERNFAPKVLEVKGEDNLVAYLIKENSVPLVSITFGFDRMGRSFEPFYGTGNIWEVVALDGAKDWDRKELRSLMKEKGIKIGISVDRDEMVVKFSYVKEFEREAFEVLKAVLFEPRLDEKDILVAKDMLVAAQRKDSERVQSKLNKLYLEKFFKNHRLGREKYALKEDLDKIDAGVIRNYLVQGMAKDVLEVGVSGDIDENGVREFLKFMFAGLREKSEIKELEEFVPSYNNEVFEIDVPSSKQSFVLMTTKSVARNDKDFYPFYVADFVFGGAGLNSRLNKVMREENGLTYGIYSYMNLSKMLNTWNVMWSASPKNTKKIEELFEKEYKNFVENGITEDELLMAKNSLLSSFNLRFNSLFSICEQLYYIKRENLGRDFLEKRQGVIAGIELVDVNRVIRKGGEFKVFRVNGGGLI